MQLANKAIFTYLLAASMVATAIGCGSSGDDAPGVTASIEAGGDSSGGEAIPAGTVAVSTGTADDNGPADASAGNRSVRPRQAVELHPVVVIKTNHGDITIQLDAENAPMTVDNFIAYVESDFYADTVFHYVEQDYMISAGGFKANGDSKETRALLLNEAHNGLKNLRGTIAMARDPQYKHSAAAQFYINLVDNPELDYESDESDTTYGYCVFGKVIEGLDVVDQIAAVPVTDDQIFVKRPTEPVVIHSVERVK